ncbi:hypothetical protein D3C72_1259000 [compost metagenome]
MIESFFQTFQNVSAFLGFLQFEDTTFRNNVTTMINESFQHAFQVESHRLVFCIQRQHDNTK